jgi:hypothetical protein
MPRRLIRWLLPVVCGALLGATAGCHQPPEWTAQSWYMARATPADATQLGCANGNRTGRMTLFFGAPTTVNGTYGATLWGAPDRDTNGIAQSVQDFIRGYAHCRTSPGFRLLIGVGTSNSAIDGKSDAWLQAHGQHWALLTRYLQEWSDAYFPGIARVNAAWDFEPSWSAFSKAEAWMHGYDFTPGRPLLYANSSADGCPTRTATNGPCNNGWSQHYVWHLAWEHDPSIPIPQIYATSGVNARQWQLIDLWATTFNGDGMWFTGTMSQWGACVQNGGCVGTDNSPHAANDQLIWSLNTDGRTRQPYVETMTDISWNS